MSPWLLGAMTGGRGGTAPAYSYTRGAHSPLSKFRKTLSLHLHT